MGIADRIRNRREALLALVGTLALPLTADGKQSSPGKRRRKRKKKENRRKTRRARHAMRRLHRVKQRLGERDVAECKAAFEGVSCPNVDAATGCCDLLDHGQRRWQFFCTCLESTGCGWCE